MSIDAGWLEKRVNPGKPVAYMGEISIAGIVGQIALVPHPRAGKNENSPSFAVKVNTSGRGWHEMGAAWSKEMKSGDWYFSLTLDGPSLPAPVYLAGFPDENDRPEAVGDYGRFNLRWGRPRGGRGHNSGPMDAAPDLGGDEVPY